MRETSAEFIIACDNKDDLICKYYEKVPTIYTNWNYILM